MTDDAQRAAIQRTLVKHTMVATASKDAAIKSLIADGIYTKDGKLAEQYGGAKKTDNR